MFIPEKTAELEEANRFPTSLPDSSLHLPTETWCVLIFFWSLCLNEMGSQSNII